MRYTIVFAILLAGSLLSAQPSSAAIYRYKDENGVVHFTNCPKDSRYKIFIGRDPEARRESLPFSSSLKKSHNLYDHWIEDCSQRFQIEFALIKAVIRAESGFNAHAVSKKGAKGLMQLMPETAKRMKVTDAFNPQENIEGGVRYLKHLFSLFENDLKLSLAAYNAGENLVAQLRAVPSYPETKDYIKKVLKFYESYKEQGNKTTKITSL